MVKKSLFTKMAVAYIAIITFSFIVLAAFLSFWFKSYYDTDNIIKKESQVAVLNDIVIDYIEKRIDVKEMSYNIKTIAKSIDSDIILVDPNNIIFEVSNPEHRKLVRKSMVDVDEYSKDSNPDITQIIKANIEEHAYTQNVNMYEKILIDKQNNILGKAFVIAHHENSAEPLSRVYQIIWISAVYVLIFSTIGIYIFSQKIIINPLADINSAAKKISKGQVERRVHIYSEDEIGELAHSFNSMADSLEKIDDNRRQFISNVSHEIRTPITSIKGFIGGILDGIIPEEKTDHYLSLVYEETKSLTRLVNDLLDLSALESGKFNQIIEEVDINEIIRISVLKFENKINSKGLNVEVFFEGDKLLVFGDKDRVVQVCTNLLDNAIKYSKENADIRITTKIKGRKVNVSFSNENEEVTSDELKKIWQRFYRVDKARTSRESSGLGLSIVRGIISQMGEDIWVEKQKEDVVFTFSLKRAKKYLR